MKTKPPCKSALALACVISALLSTSSCVRYFVVNSTGDAHDQLLDDVCDTDGSGTCTLRAAIEEANAQDGNIIRSQITFNIPGSDPGFQQFPHWVINLTSALPDLSSSKAVAIAGPSLSANEVILHGNGTFRILNITTEQTVSLSDLQIENGMAPLGQTGGAIRNANSASLNINACTITNNTGDSGGGISNTDAGIVNVTNSEISDNTAAAQNNGRGGGILNNSTGTISITNSTVAGNFSNGNGSGIANASTGTVNISNSTISMNREGLNPSAPVAQVFNASTGDVNVKSSIIATTGVFDPDYLDVSGAFTSLGFNIVGIKDTSTGFTQPTDHTGTHNAPLDSGLTTDLFGNGGPTSTVSLHAGSIAINQGNPNSPPRDQRDYTRNGIPDIGAFEFGGAIPHTLANVSTRGLCLTGDNVLIAGIIITGPGQKQVIFRALGPTLGQPPFNVPGVLGDPVLELRDSTGALVGSNDNWTTASNMQQIMASGFPPRDNRESVILTALSSGNYTAILRGANSTTGVALLEAYDLDFTAANEFTNISTRGFVQTGNNVMIAGVIVHGPDDEKVMVRALGPTLGQRPFNLPNVLADPFVDLYDANGNLIQANNNWGTSENKEDIIDTGLAPPKAAESAILITLPPGNYAAIVSGVNSTTGNALLEVYALN